MDNRSRDAESMGDVLITRFIDTSNAGFHCSLILRHLKHLETIVPVGLRVSTRVLRPLWTRNGADVKSILQFSNDSFHGCLMGCILIIFVYKCSQWIWPSMSAGGRSPHRFLEGISRRSSPFWSPCARSTRFSSCSEKCTYTYLNYL